MILPIEFLRLMSTGELAPTNHLRILNQFYHFMSIKSVKNNASLIAEQLSSELHNKCNLASVCSN